MPSRPASNKSCSPPISSTTTETSATAKKFRTRTEASARPSRNLIRSSPDDADESSRRQRRACLVARAVRRPGGSRAQGDHVEIHVQRRRLSHLPESMRPLPYRRRRRTDVSPEIRGCVSVGRVASHRAALGLLAQQARWTRTTSSKPRIARFPRASSTSCSSGRRAARRRATKPTRRRRQRSRMTGPPGNRP